MQRPAFAQSGPAAIARDSASNLQRLLGDVAFQSSLIFRSDPRELNRRRSQLARVVEMWNGSAQTAADRQELEQWLRDALRASMPGTLGPLPEPPRFGQGRPQAAESLPEPSSGSPPIATPPAATSPGTAPAAVAPDSSEPGDTVTVQRPILDPLSGPEASLTPESTSARRGDTSAAGESSGGRPLAAGATQAGGGRKDSRPPAVPGDTARAADLAEDEPATSASFDELFGIPPSEMGKPEVNPNGAGSRQARDDGADLTGESLRGTETNATDATETESADKDAPTSPNTAEPPAERVIGETGDLDLWSELAADSNSSQSEVPTTPKGDPFTDDPPASSETVANPAGAAERVADDVPDAEPPTASQPPLNMPELRSRVEGDGARLREIEAGLISSPAMTAAELQTAARRLRELIRKRELLDLYLASLTEAERATVSELRPAKPVLRLLRERITQRREAIREDTASPASDHFRELSLLEDALQMLPSPYGSAQQ